MKFKDAFTIRTDEDILSLREKYKSEGIPCVLPETLNFLTLTLALNSPEQILEIGTAVGVSGSAILKTLPNAFLTTIEKDESSFTTAKENFKRFGLNDRVKQYLADAGEVINFTDKNFDFIFLDGSKARYYDYLFDLKRLLRRGGVLFADNVLFRGYVDGGVKYGRRDNTIVRNMRDFLTDILSDDNFISQVFEIGDGVLVAVKK